MTFEYFTAPESEIAFTDEPVSCDCCGSLARCVDGVGKSKQWIVGCLTCLHAGTFQVPHETELGRIDGNSFRRHVSGNPFLGEQPVFKRFKPPQGFNRSAIETLSQTPCFRHEQHECWLVHCNDFMAYIGRWEPADFCRSAKDGDGGKLFREMTAEQFDAGLWDRCCESDLDSDDPLPADSSAPTDFRGATYHTFRCRQCAKLRGYWEI